MSENLLIIESPNKIETIGKYLKDKDFKILASIGHVRDLSTRGMGFDEKTLEPRWIIPSGKKRNIKNQKTKQEIISEIKEAASEAKQIYLATDPDREGEAIAWHVYELLNDKDKAKCKRITFNEITQSAILEALEKPRNIDIRWVNSQFARRILDRLVGYGLSKLVRKKLKGSSAGRVQTVALKLIYDREKEINAFKEEKWWTVDVTLSNDAKLILREVSKKIKNVNLVKLNNDESGTGIDFKDPESANLIKEDLSDTYTVYAVDDPKPYTVNPREPYKTSTLQQDAINRLGWNVSKVTSIAQRLYEGVRINGEHTALISYPRTDSTRIADSFVKKLQTYILNKYGEKYYQFRVFGTNSKKKEQTNVQDAHEAIRIIDPAATPNSLKKLISHEEYALYKLIWIRTIAAFMTPARYENTIIRLNNNDNKFYTYNRRLIFDGCKILYNMYEENEKEHILDLSKIRINLKMHAKNVEIKEHRSLPPPRFNQASLIKALDEAGVGRPSTYKSMANVAVERGYAKLENRAYMMLPIGNTVIEGLSTYFPYVVDKDFTKEMEEHLDEIAVNDENWKEWILEFKPRLDKDIGVAYKKIPDPQDEQVGRNCPKCNKPLVYRYAKRTGTKFIGCSGFPECHYAEFPNSYTPKILDQKCPVCGKNLVERRNRRNQPFVGCSGYPKCHFIQKMDKDGKPIPFDKTKYDKFGNFKKSAKTLKFTKQKKGKNQKRETSK